LFSNDGQRRLQFEAARLLRARDCDGGEEGLFGERGDGRITATLHAGMQAEVEANGVSWLGVTKSALRHV
jgi:hypothetical protein